MTVRKYTSRSQQTTLTSAITSGATSMAVSSATTLLATVGSGEFVNGATFTVVIDPDTAIEEIVDITAASSNTFTITRSVDAVGTAQDHSAGAVVRHMIIGRDLREPNEHIESTGQVHGLASTGGVVVGTAQTQTLTNKTLTTPIVAGATLSGTVTSTATISGGTLTGAIVTGLTSSGLADTQATPKNYVDAILVLQIASQTAAATSAASAATSASSAATSASSAATSATAASTSASSAATSASSAAASAVTAANSVAVIQTSATSAATSASSAATSASSAATSASSALTSQTAAATSASSAATSATAAANSATTATTQATAASTSATSAAASAAAASTSATSAAASATAASTSATSAAASATAASTSASSASTSASSAGTSAAAAATSAASAATSATSASTFATAASTSASSAATSASSAATSASSAAASTSAAATSAASAATSASSAATSATSAASSATAAADSYDSFDDRYLGAKSSPPSVDNDGNALITGALYWNTSVNKMYVWSGTAWAEISSSADIIAYKYTVAAGATSVSGADDNSLTLSYTVGKEQVYINGVLQVRGSDYVATTGSSITGMAAMIASDIVTVLAFTAFSVSNTYTQAEANARFVQNTNIFASGKNAVINGGMDIWQRGTSFSLAASTGGTYLADRWQTSTSTNQAITVSRQVTNDTTNLPSIQYCLRYQRNSGQTGTAGLYTFNVFESVNSIPYAGKTVTYSFYARAGANYSASSSQLNTFINTGTGTDQASFSFTNPVSIASVNSTLTTTWQRFTATGTIPTNATQMSFVVVFTPTGTAGTNDYFEITGVQIEVGSVATLFSKAGNTIQGELAACQRYYWRDTGFQSSAGVQSAYDNNVWFSLQNFNPVPMRTTPTAAIESSPYIADFQANLRTITSVNCNSKYVVGFTYSSTKLTSNLAFGLNFSDAGRALSFSSEL